MSRVARNPVPIPKGVDVSVIDAVIKVKGTKGAMEFPFLMDSVKVEKEDSLIRFTPIDGVENSHAVAGTTRSIIINMIEGVTKGFEQKLLLVGVGYKAQVQGKTLLNLTLGFSHPVQYKIPEGITIEAPSQTEIIVKGIDKD